MAVIAVSIINIRLVSYLGLFNDSNFIRPITISAQLKTTVFQIVSNILNSSLTSKSSANSTKSLVSITHLVAYNLAQTAF